MYIGVLSDTHFYFDDCLKRFFEPVDVLWHAGDFGNIAVADEIVKLNRLSVSTEMSTEWILGRYILNIKRLWWRK